MVTFVCKHTDDLLTLKTNSSERKWADFLRQIQEQINGHLTVYCSQGFMCFETISLCLVSLHGSGIGGHWPWGLKNIGF